VLLAIQPAFAAEKRVALVIGNNAYQQVKKLNNAVEDARAMSREFRALGFEVIEKLDIDQRGMKAAVREFVQKIANGGVGAFFYAGHGVQEGGNNYLLPVDIGALTDPAALPDEAVELNGEIMARIGQVGAKFSLLVVDACRDNPFPKKAGRSIGGTRGLTAANAPEGMIVVYSAGVGQQALDRLNENDRDPNGLFTREFIREIKKPGLEVAEVVRNVRTRVKEQAAKVRHEQTPAIYIQADRFYLIPDAQSVTIQSPAQDAEDSLWAQLNVSRPCEYQAYLDQYPNGKFAALARQRIKACAGGTPAPAAAPLAKPPAAEPPAPMVTAKPEDAETALWNEVKSGGAREYFDAYLKQYPKGKYAAVAKVELKKLDDIEKKKKAQEDAERKVEIARLEAEKKAAAERERQAAQQAEQDAWQSAKSGDSVASYAAYLERYPRGRYAVVAEAAKKKAQREAAEREKREAAQRQREAEQLRLAEERARKEAEKAAAELRPGKVFKDCSDCPEMVQVPAGSFDMGSNNGDNDEKPVHRVTISRSFAIGKTEVTQGQWRAVMGSNPSRFSSCGDDCPVESVSWDDAKEFMRKLNQKTGKTYRLPSEAEWEYACRAGRQQDYCGGDNVDSVAWYDGNSGSKTHPAGQKQANAWGLYDMSGNVWEWVEDCWNGSYNGAPSDGGVWTAGECGRRVLRGGSWGNGPRNVRSAKRNGGGTTGRDDGLGFRLARMLP